jgi:flagellar basal-body rod modification protein FlgD
MSVSAVSSSSSSTNVTGSSSGIADNFDTFLQLLTTQLKNQNPLDPLDTNAFTEQLVQFSSVEQQLKTNDYLAALVGSTSNNVDGNAVAYIGKTITASGARSELANGSASWTFSVPQAANISVTIKDADGNVVYTEAGSLQQGTGQFSWDGTTSTGGRAPDGTYSISVDAVDADGKSVNVSTATTGMVTGVDFTGSEPVLLVGAARINLSDVATIVIPEDETSN